MGKPAKLEDHPCHFCGEMMIGITRNRKRCIKCRRKMELEKAAIRRAKKKAERENEN